METDRSSFTRSIFANELATVLMPHRYSLDDLKRSPVSLDHKKVDPLIQSLSGLRRMPALNHAEMMSIFLLLKLSEDEQLRIYAALIALGVQRLLLDYLPPERAWLLADETRMAALSYLRQQHAQGKHLFRRPRGMARGLVPGITEEALASSDPLAAALNAFDQGTVLATMGQMSAAGEAGRELIEEAALWFSRAAKALDRILPSVRSSQGWMYWHHEVEVALEQAKDASQ